MVAGQRWKHVEEGLKNFETRLYKSGEEFRRRLKGLEEQEGDNVVIFLDHTLGEADVALLVEKLPRLLAKWKVTLSADLLSSLDDKDGGPQFLHTLRALEQLQKEKEGDVRLKICTRTRNLIGGVIPLYMAAGVGRTTPAPAVLNDLLREVTVGNVTKEAEKWREALETNRRLKEERKEQAKRGDRQERVGTVKEEWRGGRGMRGSGPRRGVAPRGVTGGGPVFRERDGHGRRCTRCGGTGHGEAVCPNRFRS